MKKGIFLLFLIVMGVNLYGQVTDSNPQPGFAFPLGTKVTLQLVPIDSENYNCRIIKFEPYHETIDLDNDDFLLPDSIENDIIELVFGYAFHGKDKKTTGNKLKVLLELKSGLTSKIEYNADIQVPDKEFESTTVIPLYHMTKTRENWPYQIDRIGLHSFRKSR